MKFAEKLRELRDGAGLREAKLAEGEASGEEVGEEVMTPKEEVRKRYPIAEAQRDSLGGWVICPGPGLGPPTIGQGATEEAAWSDAATNQTLEGGGPEPVSVPKKKPGKK